MGKKANPDTDLDATARQIRESKGLNVSACARIIGISTPALGKIEAGVTSSPGLAVLKALASLGDLSLDELTKHHAWVCLPRGLHDAAVALDLRYEEVATINTMPLRQAAAGNQQSWAEIAEISQR